MWEILKKVAPAWFFLGGSKLLAARPQLLKGATLPDIVMSQSVKILVAALGEHYQASK